MSTVDHKSSSQKNESTEDFIFWLVAFSALLTLLFCVGMVCYMLGTLH